MPRRKGGPTDTSSPASEACVEEAEAEAEAERDGKDVATKGDTMSEDGDGDGDCDGDRNGSEFDERRRLLPAIAVITVVDAAAARASRASEAAIVVGDGVPVRVCARARERVVLDASTETL